MPLLERPLLKNAREADQVAAAGNAAAEEIVAKEAAAKTVTAENAASVKGSDEHAAAVMAAESDVTNTTVGSEMTANKAAEALVTKCDVLGDTEIASTSSKLSRDESCWNCEAAFTPAHQCDGSPEPVLEASLAPKPPDPTVNNADPGRTVAPRRGLNINTFCVRCKERHPVWQKCQPVSPL